MNVQIWTTERLCIHFWSATCLQISIVISDRPHKMIVFDVHQHAIRLAKLWEQRSIDAESSDLVTSCISNVCLHHQVLWYWNTMLNALYTATFDQYHEVEFIWQRIYILFRKPAEFIVGNSSYYLSHLASSLLAALLKNFDLLLGWWHQVGVASRMKEPFVVKRILQLQKHFDDHSGVLTHHWTVADRL